MSLQLEPGPVIGGQRIVVVVDTQRSIGQADAGLWAHAVKTPLAIAVLSGSDMTVCLLPGRKAPEDTAARIAQAIAGQH